MKYSIRIAALAVVLCAAMPGQSDAQIRVGPHLGLNTEGTDLFIGLSTQVGLPTGDREVWGNLGFEVYPFFKDWLRTRLNIDALFPAGRFYGGGGLVIQMDKADEPIFGGSKSDSDVGINLKGGVLLDDVGRGMRPFIEINQTIGAGTDFSVRAGAYWGLGN